MKSKKRKEFGRAKGKMSTLVISLVVIVSSGLCMASDPVQLITFDGSSDTAQSPGAFETVYKGQVSFSHGKHAALYKLKCGQCHHDDSGEPLNNTDLADGADSCCSDCHYEEGLLRGQAKARASEDEILEHYPNAMHQKCISCHKKQNNLTHTLSAPEACRGCHAKAQGK